MYNSDKLLKKRSTLNAQYLELIEKSYNLEQTDHAMSDFYAFSATQIQFEINKLKFIIGDASAQVR